MFKFSDAEIKRILDAIFDGSITEHALPENLYLAIADYLKKGVYKGYGYNISSLSKEIGKKASSASLEDLELLAELRTNIYMFSAAKTYQQVKEMTGHLVNDNGTVASFKEFKDKAMQTFNLYNKTWLKTEYDTAIGQAQAAMSWRQIEKDAEVLNLLEYDAIMDKSTSDICRHMDGIVAPVNDPIWKKYSPLNHFNCRCLLRQHAEGDKTPSSNAQKNKAVNEIDPEMQDVFKMNAGMDGYIFKKDHPYFVVPKADKAFAQENFGLPIPKLDTELPKTAQFVPAKTLEEVAKRMALAGVKKVDLKGLKVDLANSVLEAFERESTFSTLKLDGFKTYRSNSPAAAVYSPSTNEIHLNLSHANPKTYTKQIVKSYEEDLIYYKDLKEHFKTKYLGKPEYKQSTVNARINAVNNRIYDIEDKLKKGEVARPWTIASIANDKFESLKCTMTHELGHYRQYRTVGINTPYSFSTKNSVSEYGRTNRKEYFVEWFTQYRQHGSKGVPEDLLKIFETIKP